MMKFKGNLNTHMKRKRPLKIDGIPAQVEVLSWDREIAEVEFQIYDRKGYKAQWLHDKAKNMPNGSDLSTHDGIEIWLNEELEKEEREMEEEMIEEMYKERRLMTSVQKTFLGYDADTL